MRVERAVTLECPIANAFAYLAAPEHLPAWVDGVLQARQTSSGPMGLGATFRTTEREAPDRFWSGGREWEVTAYEPPHALACRTGDGERAVETRFTLEVVDGCTRLTVAADVVVDGLFRPGEARTAAAAGRRLATALETLAALLERGAGPAGA